jgi:O-antigen ligase
MIFFGMIFCFILILGDYLLGNPWQVYRGKWSAQAFTPLALTLSIVIWPAILGQGYLIVAFICGILISVLFLTDCDASILGIIAGAIAYVCAAIRAKWMWRLVQAKIFIVILALPFVFKTYLTDENIHRFNEKLHIYSYVHRLYIWQYTANKITERPLLGFGMGSSPNDSIGGAVVDWPYTHPDGRIEMIHSKQIPLHPHNAILQWWLELGFVGVLWIIGALLLVIERIRILPKPYRQASLAFFTANAITALVSIGFWQTWWWATWLFMLPLLSHKPLHDYKNIDKF